MEKNEPTPIFYRPRDIAKMTGQSITHIYGEIQAGRLKASKFGPKSIVITPEDFKAWLDASVTPMMDKVG